MKKHEYILLLLIIFALIYYHNKSVIIYPQPVPSVPVVPNEPEIIKNDYEQALDNAIKSNKNLLAIFTADWCGYCRSLKKDLPNMDTSKYEIIELNIDNDSVKNLQKKFNIKIVPCSVVINPKTDTEIKQICGYIPDKYKRWLKE